MSTATQLTARQFLAQFEPGDEVLIAGTYRRVLAATSATRTSPLRPRPFAVVALTLAGGQRQATATYRLHAPVTRRRG